MKFMLKSIQEEYISLRDLQVKTKKIVDGVEKGKKFVVTRYSKPVGVMISLADYYKLAGSIFSSCADSKCGSCCREQQVLAKEKK